MRDISHVTREIQPTRCGYQLHVVTTFKDAWELTAQGYYPVGVATPTQRLVDDDGRIIKLKNEGDLARWLPEPIIAYGSRFGACPSSTRFVTMATHNPCVTSFTVAALLGLLPNPTTDASDSQNLLAARKLRMQNLARTLASYSVRPSGLNLAAMEQGGQVLAWLALHQCNGYSERAVTLDLVDQIACWRRLTDAGEDGFAAQAAKQAEKARWECALAAHRDSVGRVRIVEWLDSQPFDVWHQISASGPCGYPVVMAHNQETGCAEVRCTEGATADLFGTKNGQRFPLDTDVWQRSGNFGAIIKPTQRVSLKQVIDVAGHLNSLLP